MLNVIKKVQSASIVSHLILNVKKLRSDDCVVSLNYVSISNAQEDGTSCKDNKMDLLREKVADTKLPGTLTMIGPLQL